MQYAFFTITILFVFILLWRWYFNKTRNTDFIDRCRKYLRIIHADKASLIEFKLVKRYAKNRFKILYELDGFQHEILLKSNGKSFREIAKIKEIDRSEPPIAVKFTHKKLKRRKPINKVYKVNPVDRSVYYCIETSKGRRFYYSRLGQSIIPNF